MNQYRFQLERYRGRGSRYVCPKCRHKHSFTRYIDTYNNIYINDDVGKCNRLDKCGYHYTPRQYFEDNPWLRDINTSPYTWTDSHLHRQNVRPSTPPHTLTPFQSGLSRARFGVATHMSSGCDALFIMLVRCTSYF